MATHAPLTKDGKIPAHEESRERWTTKQMIDMLKERFPKLRGTVSSVFLCLFDVLEEDWRDVASCMERKGGLSF